MTFTELLTSSFHNNWSLIKTYVNTSPLVLLKSSKVKFIFMIKPLELHEHPKKSNLPCTRNVTPKRVTSGARGSTTPKNHRSDDDWRVVDDMCPISPAR